MPASECVECGRGLGPAAGTGRPRRYCSRACRSRAYRRRRDEGRREQRRREQGRTGGARRLGPPPGPAATERHHLVEVAVGLADAAGVRAVTLRTVADRAGVPLTEVRRLLGGRDRLVEAMVQHLMAGPRAGPARPDGGDPAATLRALAQAEWAAYRRHPWLVQVLASSRPPLVPAVLDAARTGVEAFVALGVGPPSALGRYVALSGYVQGMALLLLAEHDEARSATSYPAWWVRELDRLERTGARRRHGWLDAATGGAPPGAFGSDVETWFRDGLDRVLAGLVSLPPAGEP
ncbi:TetR/AcrR family transcriptional regulator [Promicromonospora thailandica]|uniref:Transcriptional regulator, TetR family n=1 Tax=Promicromonospora thailandica TaxID=765201 RepID=A0A9X2G4H1_9MICO|nr:TetR/AcrR family transcriptional regulator C-terminal domain-containing protein [Promicromonospora thailandica]MCP2266977.1 transcriptional regulator, TetR family [Promicromonospora thailandica]